jgi:hypothetical protein
VKNHALNLGHGITITIILFVRPAIKFLNSRLAPSEFLRAVFCLAGFGWQIII